MENMQQWEIDLRLKLEEEIPEGIYSITIEGKKYLTGRGGVIDQKVEEERARRNPPTDQDDPIGI